jgi:methylthioribose-1-phosphate isomerase
LKINGKHYRSVWPIGEDAIGIIDQTKLPHEFVTLTLRSAEDAARAISSMQTRGAPLIGAVGAYGLALAMRADASDENLQRVHDRLAETRPTAINLRWALGRMRDALLNRPRAERARLAGSRRHC